MDNPLTLQEAKDQVAKKRYFTSWNDFIMIEGNDEQKMEDMLNEAATIWNLSERKRTWDECYEATIQNINWSDQETPKPEFKP